ncbi:DUF1801 domain-containing protein [Granulosicoccus antarcticus]|uniref:YdhG-like domain-containing protein n=1 Tax=Granulosicoccus antarcticus IMCC3135 TaxID=1192854 RepID=A0A2Z2P147_9GAMM|nr:DUF1801 domain-containing protein [Granulosicoccus antarcticus]ASJ76151.1 hypothetical protein IMCC3135_30510 [Granulosicoccus antarcticus IMCC3135]
MAAKTSDNKTQPTDLLPMDFIAGVEHSQRRSDAEVLLDWFHDVTGFPAVMWGGNIVGYGRYHYVYDSGRSGDSLITGFSPRKANLSIYIMPGYLELDEYLQRLGKYKIGKSCLYINKLSDIYMTVLAEIVSFGVSNIQKNYQNWQQ